MPAALTTLFCTEDDVRHLLGSVRELSALDDDDNGVLNTFESASWTQAVSFATTKVSMYCQPLYVAADLATSWMVNEWATIIAAHWLCLRRCNPVPQSIHNLMHGSGGEDRGVMGDLRDVQKLAIQIPDIGYRHPQWPGYSNGRDDPRYRLRRYRIQKQISEKTPKQYPQTTDWTGEFTWEF